jgi:hypothetical protein
VIAAVLVIALLLAGQLVRLTIGSSYSEERPSMAARLAPGIPDVLAAKAMAEVGQAAAVGDRPGEQVLGPLHLLARRAPLSTEPFLFQAALAQREGELGRAEQLLLQARRRNPRSPAARYLLADVWMRQGNALSAVVEMAILARLIPGGIPQLVPALSAYAGAPGARDELGQILKVIPGLRQPLLDALAADPDNTELVLSLAGEGSVLDDTDTQTWQPRLLAGLVERGDYQRAYALWRRFSGLGDQASPLLFNGDFRQSPAPAPFNWVYSSGTAGLAEPTGGTLRVLHFGRDNFIPAEQLLLLPPGNYRFSSPVSGNLAQNALVWSLVCERPNRQLMEFRLGNSTRASFSVPPDCPAQRLQLRAQAAEMPKASDVQIGPVSVERAGV